MTQPQKKLGKLAGQVYRHDLTGKLEAALRASNAQVTYLNLCLLVGLFVSFLDG